MQIVIDIPEVFYEALRKTDEIISGQRSGKTFMSVIYNAVANGTPLPKGHGRLIDAEVFSHNVVKYSHQSTKTIGQALADTPTIIEADTKSDEQEKVDDYRDILDELEREEYYESKYGKEQE